MKSREMLLVNGNIYTMEREGEKYSGMLIKDGKIVTLYKDISLNELGNNDVKKIVNLNGKTVIPAFTDCHTHFLYSALLTEIALNISEIKNGILYPSDLEGVKEKVIRYASEKDPKEPIICYNYIISSIEEDRLPLIDEIEKWLPGRNVVFLSMDGHSSSYSMNMLKLMGLYERGHSGILVGEDHEFNMGKLVEIILNEVNVSMFIKGVQKFVNKALDNGIVGIHCLEGTEDNLDDKSLKFASKFLGMLPLYIRLFIQYKDIDLLKHYVEKLKYPRLGGCGAWEMDGSVGSKSAAFYESYRNDVNNNGECYYTVEEIEKYVEKAHLNGYQLTSHAIGPRGIEVLLSSYENVYGKYDEETNFLRHRIDHFEFPTTEQVHRAIDKLNLIIVPQPGYAWADEQFQKSYIKYLTDEQFNSQIPMKTIVEKGGIICGSSDSPVQDINPWIQIHGMVNFPIEEEQLSVYEAIRTYTYNAAYSTFEENERGTLSVGKWADFILLDRDPFNIPKDTLVDVEVLDTYLHGNNDNKMNYSTITFMLKILFNRDKKSI